MNELKCQFAKHCEQKIISVCLSKDCAQERLCCFQCVSQFHSTHNDKLIGIEQFNNFMKNVTNQSVQAVESYTYAQNQIIQALEQLRKIIFSFQEIVQKQLQEIKRQNLREYVQKFNNTQQTNDFLNLLIENILKYVEANTGILTKKEHTYGQLNQMESKSLLIIKESESSLQKIIQSIDTLSQLKPLKFNRIPIKLEGHEKTIRQVVISQDGAIIVSSSDDNSIKVWDTQSKQIIKTIQCEVHAYRIVLSCNNQFLASYFGYDEPNNLIKIHDLKNNKCIWTLKTKKILASLVFSQNSQYLLTVGQNNKLAVYSMINMKLACLFGTHNYIGKIIISPDNKYISCLTSADGTICIWDLQTKNKLIQENDIHEDGYSLCSSADSSIYITSGAEGLIKVWKLNQLQDNKYSLTLTKSIETNTICVLAVFTSDQQYIISMGNYDAKILIYERVSGDLIQKLNSGKKSKHISSISITNDMKYIVSTNYTNDIKVWTIE